MSVLSSPKESANVEMNAHTAMNFLPTMNLLTKTCRTDTMGETTPWRIKSCQRMLKAKASNLQTMSLL
jgi:hypothetical protein